MLVISVLVPMKLMVVVPAKQDSGDGVDQFSIVMTVNEQTVSPAISGTPSDYILTNDPPHHLERREHREH